MKITKFATRGKVALVLASFTLVAALYSFTKPNTAPKEKVSGRELFEGIFFLKGDVARQLPVLKPLNKYSANEMSPSIQTATNERQEKFIGRLLQKDNLFFTNFQTEMTSGDAFRVSAMLVKAIDLSKEVLNEMPQLRTSAGTNSKVPLLPGTALDTYCEIVVYNPCFIVYYILDDEEQANDLHEPFTKELLVKQIIEHFDSK